jgi:hypothetical protein
MKKLLYFTIFMGGTIAFTSCAKEDECVCDSGISISEDDAANSDATLQEACDLQNVGDNCSIK